MTRTVEISLRTMSLERVLAVVLTVAGLLAVPGYVPAGFAGAVVPFDTPQLTADITGHWEADVTGDGRSFTFLFDFATAGDTLTGTVELSTQDRSFSITHGKVSGNNVSFIAFGVWTGTLVGDELHLTRGLDYGREQKMTARRKPKR